MDHETPGLDAEAARNALARSSRAEGAGQDAARRSLWRHCAAAALGSVMCLLVVGALNRWVGGTVARALLTAVSIGAVVAVVSTRLELEQVRAVVSGRRKSGVAIGGVLVFALAAGAGPDQPLAYPVGAAALLAYWLVAAWWLTRGR